MGHFQTEYGARCHTALWCAVYQELSSCHTRRRVHEAWQQTVWVNTTDTHIITNEESWPVRTAINACLTRIWHWLLREHNVPSSIYYANVSMSVDDDNQSTHQSPQQAHWQNTFITASRAMEDYLLDTEWVIIRSCYSFLVILSFFVCMWQGFERTSY